jgi:uncharacterized protein
MSSTGMVWFIPADYRDGMENVCAGLTRLIEAIELKNNIENRKTAQIKVHFGEQGNTGYVRPELVETLTSFLRGSGVSSEISDTNTLYRGQRTRCDDHLQLARQHGFTDEAVGGKVVIADDYETGAVKNVSVDGRRISEANVFARYTDAEVLISLAHFKGHIIVGAGGALKNIGMGCASREGKLAQHCTVAPFVEERKCIGCEACAEVCPAGAVSFHDGKAKIDAGRCIGCASCIAACGSGAVEIDWGSGASQLTERMVEYASAVLRHPGKKVFVNVAMHITAECDCIAGDDPLIVPDVGLFISEDPVAIDQACYDLCCRAAGGYDPFRKAHPHRDCTAQLDYAEGLGLGTRSHQLVEVTA